MTIEERKTPLPKGWKVVENSAVGYDYFDETGRLVMQHPYDTESALAVAWDIYRRDPPKKE